MLKSFLIGLASLCLLLCAIGLLLPGTARIERSVVIDRPAAQVFAVLNDMSQFNSWSPWYDLDPKAKHELSGPQSGPGATLSWSGNDEVGSGTQRIVASVPDSRIDVALEFSGFGAATTSYLLAAEGAGTRVTWAYEGQLGLNPLMRWLGLFMDGWVGPDYEKGLGRLKAYIENTPAAGG
jgi:uncharacterized protein YndB with AHSA1/START domain